VELGKPEDVILIPVSWRYNREQIILNVILNDKESISILEPNLKTISFKIPWIDYKFYHNDKESESIPKPNLKTTLFTIPCIDSKFNNYNFESIFQLEYRVNTVLDDMGKPENFTNTLMFILERHLLFCWRDTQVSTHFIYTGFPTITHLKNKSWSSGHIHSFRYGWSVTFPSPWISHCAIERVL